MSKCIYENTYWNHKGNHPKLKDAVQALIPNEGEVPNCDDNPHLEQFRKAANCYYDLYNNGLCNLAEEFESVFGFLPESELTIQIVNRTERIMNRILKKAAIEQGISV